MLLYFLFSPNDICLLCQIYSIYCICVLWSLWQLVVCLKPPLEKICTSFLGFSENWILSNAMVFFCLFDSIVFCILNWPRVTQTLGFNHLVQKTYELYMIYCKLFKRRNHDSFICMPHGMGQSTWHIPSPNKCALNRTWNGESRLNTQLDICWHPFHA